MLDSFCLPQGHLTVVEACLVLQVSAATLSDWIRDGLMPCLQTRRGGVLVPAWAVALAGATTD
ncbi:helix-turn-helix domain-containing protein [Solicola sp. PLA-1-18]|uniref:helix-turn-helix domain-containing protein n=1 Tax=Solicola sp. PLA-1-18 TaxID=3380532 RepID=UPI003B7CC838